MTTKAKLRAQDIRVTGYDKDGIPRVWGSHPTDRATAIKLCKEAAADYVKVRESTGPLSKWRFGDAIEVGDVVTWRSSKHPNALGVANCKVLEVGRVDKEDRPAAMIEAMGQKVGALIADLHHE